MLTIVEVYTLLTLRASTTYAFPFVELVYRFLSSTFGTYLVCNLWFLFGLIEILVRAVMCR